MRIRGSVYPGLKIGNLTVIEKDKNPVNLRWVCQCSCGNICTKLHRNFKSERKLACPSCIKERVKADRIKRQEGYAGQTINAFKIIKYLGHDPNSKKTLGLFEVKCIYCKKKLCLNYNNIKLLKSCGCFRRYPKGERNAFVKFSDLDIAAIRDFYDTKIYSIPELRAMFDVSECYLKNIVKRKARV